MRAMRPRSWIIAATIALLLALAFGAYFQPGFMVDLANRWVFC